jgi:hypothetical protein
MSREEIMREMAGLRDMLDEKIARLDAVATERDRRYGERSDAQQLAVKDALAAQEKLAGASRDSSEKAIEKAESAQRDYNVRSNEFRGQLDDQAKTLMPRQEALAEFTRIAERFDDWKKELEAYKANQASEIRSLRESRAGYGGMWQAVAGAALLAGLIGFVLSHLVR